MAEKRCIGCGKAMPRRPVDKGWTVSQLAAKGYGQHWYRQCGCMASLAYYELTEFLFAACRDYPVRFPVRREEAKSDA